MLRDAIDALADVFSPPFRAVMLKSAALTLAVLIAAGVILSKLAIGLLVTAHGWLAFVLSVALSLGVIFGLVLLAAPVTSLVASFFFDEIAAAVEREIDPSGIPGRPAPVLETTVVCIGFSVVTLGVTLMALVLWIVPVIGVAAWWGANAYLLGRIYFELSAMRFRPAGVAREMRRRFGVPVFLAGLFIAAFVAVPILNLATPLFATALMVRTHRRLSRVASIY